MAKKEDIEKLKKAYDEAAEAGVATTEAYKKAKKAYENAIQEA